MGLFKKLSNDRVFKKKKPFPKCKYVQADMFAGLTNWKRVISSEEDWYNNYIKELNNVSSSKDVS